MNIKLRLSWSISSKMWFAITFLILAVLGGLGLTITLLFGDFYLKQNLNSLQIEATGISVKLGSVSTWSERSKLLDAVKLTNGIQMVVIDPSGDILMISGGSNPNNSQGLHGIFGGRLVAPDGTLAGGWSRNIGPTDYFNDQDLIRVLAGETISRNALPMNGGGQAMLIAATPVGAKPVQQVILLGSSPIPIQETITTFRWLIFYASLIAVFMAAVVSLFFARQVARPLEIMQRGAKRMAKGNFLPIQGITSNDEIGELAKALNSMGQSLKDHMEWLSQEKNLLQGIVESISDAVVMLSFDGSILYANDTAKALWQEDDMELQERKTLIVSFIKSMAQGENQVGNATLTLGIQVLQVVMAPMSEIDGIRGNVAVLRDITASLRSEKARREFLASVTHELRTPLHLIQGYLEAIQDEVIPEHQRGEYIELVLEEAKRLARLVTDLQDINWLEKGQSLQRVSLDLDSFMSDIDQRFQGRAQELGVNLEIAKGSGTLFVDSDRFLQVFINLIDNALGHTPRGKTVRVLLLEEQEQIRLAFQDEGEGIPKEALPFIFDRFFRVNKARTRKDGGMGLGLAIVRQIIETHGGNIKVESDMGKGTTFWITLPRK